MAIYKLNSDCSKGSLIELYDNVDNSVAIHSMRSKGEPLALDFVPTFEIDDEDGSNDDSFNIDLCSLPFLVVSRDAYEILFDIIENHTQLVSVSVKGSDKDFVGIHILNDHLSAIDIERSEVKKYEKGTIIRKPVFISEIASAKPIFKIYGLILPSFNVQIVKRPV